MQCHRRFSLINMPNSYIKKFNLVKLTYQTNCWFCFSLKHVNLCNGGQEPWVFLSGSLGQLNFLILFLNSIFQLGQLNFLSLFLNSIFQPSKVWQVNIKVQANEHNCNAQMLWKMNEETGKITLTFQQKVAWQIFAFVFCGEEKKMQSFLWIRRRSGGRKLRAVENLFKIPLLISAQA